jgi:hypothetical protein
VRVTTSYSTLRNVVTVCPIAGHKRIVLVLPLTQVLAINSRSENSRKSIIRYLSTKDGKFQGAFIPQERPLSTSAKAEQIVCSATFSKATRNKNMSACKMAGDLSASDWCESVSRMTVAEPKTVWHRGEAPNGGWPKDLIPSRHRRDRSARY